MPAGDLSHEMNLMTYPDMGEDNMATGPHEVQLHCRPFSISTCSLQEDNWQLDLTGYSCIVDPILSHGVMLEPTVGSQGCAA